VRGFLLVTKAEVKRMLIIMRRYWFATAIGIVIGYSILMMVIVAFMNNRETVEEAAGSFGEGATNFTLGIMIGMWSLGLTGLFTQSLQGMARTGELEQVCMSPYGLVTNFFARSFVSAINSIFTLCLMAGLIVWTVGSNVHFHPVLAPLLIFLTYANLVGFGFMCGGLALVFKQVGQLTMILRLVMMGLALLATTQDMEAWPPLVRGLSHVLPITDAAYCLKLVLLDGWGYELFGHSAFFFMILNAVLWTSIGVTLFRLMEDFSRDKGTLGTY